MSYRRPLRALVSAVVALILVVAGLVGASVPASAASRGAGFGTWAPLSAHGWHGSMLIGGIHTYCILPGAPAPTGPSTDHGASTTAAGLSPAQLTQINFLVSTYGQTDDPVRAAAVAWSVKAIANRALALGGFGYRGDSLADAIDWTFRRLAPEHSAAVQRLAVAYVDEAQRLGAAPARPRGTITLTTDAADHRAGSVRVEANVPGATGTLTLRNAVFTSTGTAQLKGAVAGTAYPITTAPPHPGVAYRVGVSGRFTGGFSSAVRHFTTPGGQDTAGPAGRIAFDVAAEDAEPRIPPFTPALTTQVAAPYVSDGPFVDVVTFSTAAGEWPRTDDGAYRPLRATGTVYRTDVAPQGAEGIPDRAVAVGELVLDTDPDRGPTAPYTVTSAWTVTEPGFYTAVWTIRAPEQSDELAAHLEPDFAWQEAWGTPSQIAVSPDITTRAQPTATPGGTMSDTIVVGAPLAPDGLVVVAAVYRAPDGAPAEESCVPEQLVWESDPFTVDAPGEYVVTAPHVPGPGTYYWQERASDARGTEVHRGVCGIENETTRVAAPPPPEPAAPPPGRPAALAATGSSLDPFRISGIAAGIVLLGISLVGGSRPRRRTLAPGT